MSDIIAKEWSGGCNPFLSDDPEERRVLFAALDSFRWVLAFFILRLLTNAFFLAFPMSIGMFDRLWSP